MRMSGELHNVEILYGYVEILYITNYDELEMIVKKRVNSWQHFMLFSHPLSKGRKYALM